MKRVRALVLLGAVACSGCALFGKGGDNKGKNGTPVLGNRISILASENAVDAEPALAAVPVVLPPELANDSWAQAGGNPAHSMGHPALGKQLAKVWTISIGQGSTPRARLASGPVVANKRIYTIDAEAVVRAFDTADGRLIWTTPVKSSTGKNDRSLFGGGVSVDGDHVFATNGVGDVAGLNAADGKLLWTVRPGGPLRGAPSIGGANIYVVSQDNQIFALNAADGKTAWQAAASVETAGVFGVAAPAIGQGTVIAGFSSGELNAYRYENGRSVWEDALSRTSISTAVASLADIDADPVIDNGTVYAIGQGGRMVAVGLVSGQREWEINVAGIDTPWVAGDWLFVVTDDAKLLCIARASGKIRWISELPRWRSAKRQSGPIQWSGPILAGGRLILASSRGELANLDPANGHLQSSTDAGAPVHLAPIVADNTLFVLTDDGKLSAWR